MTRLEELGMLYDTDKVHHRYLPHYENRFRELQMQPVTLVEIGILRGASLRMWRDYFPFGQIVGVDIDSDALFEEDRIKTFQASQSDAVRLTEIAEATGEIDIVIDDASHVGPMQLISFQALVPFVKSGGWYCIEDCHTFFNTEYTDESSATILKYLYNRRKKMMRGRSPIREASIIGDGRKDGLVCMRMR